jgi:hypothetical protein
LLASFVESPRGALGSQALEPPGEVKPPPEWLDLTSWALKAAAEHLPRIEFKQHAYHLRRAHLVRISRSVRLRTSSHYHSFAQGTGLEIACGKEPSALGV